MVHGGVRIAFETHGCRLNQSETDALEQMAVAAGHTVTPSVEVADALVLNTCSITHEADADARQRIRRARRQNPQAKIVVTGCYATRAAAEVAALGAVDAVVGNPNKSRLFDHLRGPSNPAAPDVDVGRLSRRMPFSPLAPAVHPRRSRSYLKVQDGCNYRCAFCIVPHVRGGSRSLAVEDVTRQLKTMVLAGRPEVVLTGAHLGTYGRDLRPRVTVAELIEALLPHLQGARLRLGSLDPHEVSPKLVTLLRDHPTKLCRYLHLPLQSGDPQVLRRMRRGHSADDFRRLVEELAATVPGVAVGADVIVGFPGETESAFERTRSLLASLPVAYLHVFPYSPREGTPAAEMPDPVPPEVKAHRGRVLRELSQAKSRAFRRSMAGRRVPALVLGGRTSQSGRHVALSDNYLKFEIEGASDRVHQWVSLRVGAKGQSAALE